MLASMIDSLFNAMLALGLGIARIFPCVLITPVFSFSSLKGMVRTSIVVALALFVTPTIEPQIAAMSLNAWGMVGLALKEIILGLFLGLLLALPFWLFASVGALFDNQRGALTGGQLNPTLGPDATPLGDMLRQWIIILLILSFGLSLITQVIWDSYGLWPVDAWLPALNKQGFDDFLHRVADMFVDMVMYAGPLVLLLMLLDFCVGILSIYSPQLQATVLTVPVKCLVGVLFFIIYLPTLEYLANHQLLSLRDLIPHISHILPPQGKY
ncbi:type III secretion protein T [Paramixta manurensis]|uniref:Type III secretion protein T n=1 Tax=Paramixta manurensis TaxID=2740817 RepID=A0A6M8U9V0_9GAMM|nr:type III secretion protein T [Erwiniaceae bacterium PD-1]